MNYKVLTGEAFYTPALFNKLLLLFIVGPSYSNKIDY
jgi:hypothetical protein